jgi:hypothetical protein
METADKTIFDFLPWDVWYNPSRDVIFFYRGDDSGYAATFPHKKEGQKYWKGRDFRKPPQEYGMIKLGDLWNEQERVQQLKEFLQSKDCDSQSRAYAYDYLKSAGL